MYVYYDIFILTLQKQEDKEMDIQKCVKESFVVIGKEGSTSDGEGFVQRLWSDANAHFSEVSQLAKKDNQGNLVGIWGVMSDISHMFNPWEDGFTKGLYLAGVECDSTAEAPRGWTKWVIPGFEYLYVECDSNTTFADMTQHLNDRQLSLAGAVHDYICPQTGKNYMYFPIKKL